jgi:hypothetical protein
MSKITQNQIIAQCGNVPASLVRAVIKQSGGIDSFREMASDIANHGIMGGYSGWIYYTETCAFYAKHRKSILEMLNNMRDDFGMGYLVELVQSFNGAKDSTEWEIEKTLFMNKSQHDTQVANLLAWVACEEVAWATNDLVEGN